MAEPLRAALERTWGAKSDEHTYLDYSRHPLGNMMQMHNELMNAGRPTDNSCDRFSLKLKRVSLSLDDAIRAVCLWSGFPCPSGGYHG